jgi:hypothetical protein
MARVLALARLRLVAVAEHRPTLRPDLTTVVLVLLVVVLLVAVWLAVKG